MIRLFLEGVYNHGESCWLDISWTFRGLFRSYIHKELLGDIFTGWLEVMPKAGLVRFSDYRGHTIWRYKMVHSLPSRNELIVILCKGYKNSPVRVAEDDVQLIIEKAHENLFYQELETTLIDEAPSVDPAPASQEQDS